VIYLQVQKGHREIRAFKESRVPKVLKGLLVLLGLKARKELQVPLGPKVNRVKKVIPVIQMPDYMSFLGIIMRQINLIL
jgi:hypothetical protein